MPIVLNVQQTDGTKYKFSIPDNSNISFGSPPPLSPQGPQRMQQGLNVLQSTKKQNSSVSSCFKFAINILKHALIYTGNALIILGGGYFFWSLAPIIFQGIVSKGLVFIGQEIIASGSLNLLISGIIVRGFGEVLEESRTIISMLLSMAWFIPNPFGVNNFPIPSPK